MQVAVDFRVERSLKGSSTRVALAVVYAGYATRYLSLIILIPYYGRVLAPVEYGKVLTAMSLMGVIWMLVNYGFSPVGTRNVAGMAARRALAREFGRHIDARLSMSLLAIAAGAVAIVASPVLRAQPMFGVLAIVLGMLSGFNLGWYFQGTRQYTTSILLEVAGFAINVLLVLALVKSQTDSLLVLVALVASNTITLIAANVIALRQLRGARIRLRGGVSLIKESTSLFLLSAVPTMALTSSSYLLSLFTSAGEVGHFGSAERLATAIVSLFGPANQVMLSTISAKLGSGAHESESFAMMRKGTIGLTGFGLLAALGTVGLAPFVVPVIFGPGFEPSVRILQLLAISFPFTAFSQAMSVYVLVPLRQESAAVRVSLLASVAQVIALALLAIHYGGQGAAMARSMAEILGAVLLFGVLRSTGTIQKLTSLPRIDAVPAGSKHD